MYPQLSVRGGLGLSLLALASALAFAQTPVQAPQPFNRVGVISALDLAEGFITVNDLRYHLPSTVHVYPYNRTSKDPQAGPLKDGRAALRVNMRIGYNVTGEGGGKRGDLVEAWILPAGSTSELERGDKGDNAPGTKGTGKAQGSQSAR